MSNKEKTKLTLLDAGRKVFSERGYNGAGIEAILQEAGVPKGSFYYYFQSKEDFALQVIDRFAEAHRGRMETYLDDEAAGPLERLRRLFGAIIEHVESGGCRQGCLVGKLSQELAEQSEAFRARLEEIFEGWVDRYAECLRQAQAAGELAPDLDVRSLAEFLLNSWQGAVMRAKTMRSTAPLRTFLDMIFASVLQA